MNCSEVQELLSAYYDGELPCSQQTVLSEHLRQCAQCNRSIETFREVSGLLGQITSREPPAALWVGLESKMDSVMARPEAGSFYGQRLLKLATLAALLLIAVTTWMYAHGLKRAARILPALAVDLDYYLDEFQLDPTQSPQVFLARYDGQSVPAEEATKHVEFRPVTADRLPDGFSLQAVYLLKMECCTGLESVYKRKGSEVLAILQHTTDQPVWLGNRAVVTAEIHGKPTRIVQVDGSLAATWRAGGTYVSLIGVQNIEELTSLITYIEHNTIKE